MVFTHKLKTGDLIFCNRDTLLSRIIRWFTKSEFSHVAVVIEVWGQLYIIDAQKDGVQLRRMDAWLKKYKYKDLRVGRRLGQLNEHAFAMRAMTKCGVTRYDIWSLIFRQPIHILTGKWIGKTKDDDLMYCSDFAGWSHFIEDYEKMSPQDLYNHTLYSEEYYHFDVDFAW